MPLNKKEMIILGWKLEVIKQGLCCSYDNGHMKLSPVSEVEILGGSRTRGQDCQVSF